jgi:hypothetical protein
VFVLGWSIGNAAEGSYLVIDRRDGVFMADINYQFDAKIRDKKLILETAIKYKKIRVIEFDGKNITSNYDAENNKWVKINIALKKLE